MRLRSVVFVALQLAFLLAVAVSGVVTAQGQPVGLADSLVVTENIYQRLFAGIVVPDSSRKLAKTVIKRQFVEQMRLQHRGAMTKERWYLAVAKRNSTLRALLATEGQRRQFDANTRR
jgi:hypothetical protein